MPETITRWPWGPTPLEHRIGNAWTRVIVAVVGIGLLYGLFSLGPIGFHLFVLLLAVGTIVELRTMIAHRSVELPRWPLLVGGTAVIVTTALATMTPHPSIDPAFPILLSYCFATTLILVTSLKVDRDQALSVLAFSLMVLMYPLFQLSALQLVYWRGLQIDSPLGLIMMVLASIWVCDSFAYLAGRAFGRHKLFERVSPKKSWEGAIAGGLASPVFLAFVGPRVVESMTIVDGIAIGLIAGIFGQVGDLVESHIKRACGVKDSSNIIPGHGGVLDRFDSLIFVAPLVFAYLMLKDFL